MGRSHVIISSTDYNRLLSVIGSARLDRRIPAENLDALDKELARATVMDIAELPADVVAMNSTVCFVELDSEETESYTLVYPGDADVTNNRISILAPIGTALLGYRVGDVVRWRVPSGECAFKIVEVIQHSELRQLGEEAVLA